MTFRIDPPGDLEWQEEQFRSCRWRQVGSAADTDASKDTTAIDVAKAICGRCTKHKTSTKNEDSGEDHETPSATVEVAKGIGEEGTEEGTSLVARDDVCLEEADTGGAEVVEAEFIDEGR